MINFYDDGNYGFICIKNAENFLDTWKKCSRFGRLSVNDDCIILIGNRGNDNGNLIGFLRKIAFKNKVSYVYKPYDTTQALVYNDTTQETRSVGEFSNENLATFYELLSGRSVSSLDIKTQRTFLNRSGSY